MLNSTFYVCISLLTSAASTADGNSISVSGQGNQGSLSNVLISVTIRHDCISISQPSDIDINVTFTPCGVSVANGVAPVCGRREDGLFEMSMQDSLCSSSRQVVNIDSQNRMWMISTYGIVVWLICRIVLYERLCGIRSLRGRCLIKKKLKIGRAIGASMGICACANMHQISFPGVQNRLEGSPDVRFRQNIMSREGYQYVFFNMDHATKMC